MKHKRTRKVPYYDGEKHTYIIYEVDCSCPIGKDHCEITKQPQNLTQPG